MADDIVTRLREMANGRARYATHSDGCVERHLECAALHVCNELDQLLRVATKLAEALEALLDNPGEYGAAFTALSHWHHRTCCPATPAD